MATYNINKISLPNGDVCNLKTTNMSGASSTDAGSSGAVPAPSAGDEGKFLRGDGTWATVSGSGTDNDTITTWYGTSNTTAGTAAKVVACSGFSLVKGAIISVLFSTANTAATPTLNVNSTGALAIYAGTGTLNATTNVLKWSANTLLTFMYDGTYYRYISARAAASVVPPDGAGTWYGTCSTTATTQAKVGTVTNFRLMPGAFVVLRCTTANTYATAKITLNINSTGAKDVYANNAVTSATNTLFWDVGDILTFVYDGTYYRFVSSDRAEKKADDLFKIVEYQYAYTLAANTGANIASTDLGVETPSGYAPLSFANVLTGNAGVVIRSMQPRLVGTSTAILSLRNVTSASVSATVTVQLIYVKTDAIAS